MKLVSKFIQPLNETFSFQVGSNAQDNFTIIDESNNHDLWFHIEKESSCHVICSMPEETHFDKKQLRYIIKQGALICKQYSRFKSMPKIDVIYTTIANITKTDTIGRVIVENGKTIAV